MSFTAAHKVLRNAALHVLSSPCARNSIYTMDVFAQIMNAVMKASVWDGDEQDDRITAGLLQKAFNLGRLSQKDGNFVPFNVWVTIIAVQMACLSSCLTSRCMAREGELYWPLAR
mmetsp:Transcript_1038/g.1939  ORF Transcript_1038/g.1939 Transcript_1038/m.1939 type:complete len:115 (-) Transcript_1038:1008-1352(-)